MANYFNTKKSYEKVCLDNILSNLYAGFNTLQLFNRKYFVKWVKNYHRIILNRINLNYLINQREIDYEIHNQIETDINEEYFKLLQLFLNSYDYMS
jgi:hypothetical protein